MTIKLHDCAPKRGTGLGATLADQHMTPIHKSVANGTIPPGTLVVLDFTKLDAVNGSYIKGTALWLLTEVIWTFSCSIFSGATSTCEREEKSTASQTSTV